MVSINGVSKGFDWAGIRRWSLILIGCFVGLSMIVFNILIYRLYDQQQVDLKAVQEKLDEQQATMSQYKADIQALSEQIKGQRDLLSDQARKTVDIEKGSVQIKGDVEGIKNDGKQWQKDYVAALLKIEAKSDSFVKEFKEYQESFFNQVLPDIKQEIESIRSDVDKINNNLPAAPNVEHPLDAAPNNVSP